MEIGHILAERYKIIEQIGSGGMSLVYRAHEIGLKREVAIKVLISALTDDPQLVERFNREAQTIAGLQHPNIIPIYFYGTESFGSFLVMPLLKGGSLDQRIKQLDIYPSISEVGDLAEKLGSALKYAHQKGIIHRDIKFSNIMFDDTGSPYLVDFGIAKMLGATNLTGTGMTIGTPQFMPPEQWRNEEITQAVDQYALAILLYAMLTKKMPFEAPTPHALMYQHLQDMPPPIHTYRDDIPDTIEDALHKAMSKDPNDRYPTIEAFTNVIAESARDISRQATGFFSSPIAYKPTEDAPQSNLLPNTPTEMVSPNSTTVPHQDATQMASTQDTDTNKSKRSALVGGLLVALLLGAIAVIAFFVIGEQNNGNATSTIVAFNAQNANATETAIQLATDTPTASETATITPNGTGTALADLATQAEVEQITQIAIEQETATAIIILATEHAQANATASIDALNIQASQEAVNQAAANEISIAETDAAQQANQDATAIAIAVLSTEQANQLQTATQQAIETIDAEQNATITAIVASNIVETQQAIETANAAQNATTTAIAASNIVETQQVIETANAARNGTITAIAVFNAQVTQAAIAAQNGTITAIAVFNAQATQTAIAAQSGTITALTAINATATQLALQSSPIALAGMGIDYGQLMSQRGNNEQQDIWAFDGQAGDIISIALRSSDFDPVLELQQGGLSLRTDNNSGYGDDAHITNFQLPTSGTYNIIVSTSDNSPINGDYTLGLTEVLQCPDTQISRLLIGERARITFGGGANRIRQGASTSSSRLGNIPEGGDFEVIGGPVCNNGFAWFQIEYHGTIGWTAEGDDDGYWTEPLPDDAPIMLTNGIGLTTGVELGPGEMQVETFCTERGLSATSDGIEWYCTDNNGQIVDTFNQNTYNQLCRDTYNEADAFALQQGEGSGPAYRWRCYHYPD